MLTETQCVQLRAAFDCRAISSGVLSHAASSEIAAETALTLRQVEYFALQNSIVPARYERNLGTFGADGQCKLLASRILIVGLGGLGGHVAETTARLGYGHIVASDPDSFVENNLNRQLLATIGSLGRPKAELLIERLRSVNPAVEVSACGCAFEELSNQVFGECDLVFDCLDSIEARHRLAARCDAAGVALVHGAIAGWFGQVALRMPGGGLIEKLYGDGVQGMEGRLGNLPFTAALAANLMVARAVAFTLERGTGAQEDVLLFDLIENDWETVDLL